MDFIFTDKQKKFSFLLMGLGALFLILGIVGGDHHGHLNQRIWSNLLIDGFFFFAIALGALFFMALQYATETGWSSIVKRIFEGMYSYLPIGAGVIVVVLIAGNLQIHHLYHWMNPEVLDPTTDQYDVMIVNKWAYLNPIFFWVRTIAYITTYLIFAKKFRERSLKEDEIGGTELHFINYRKSAVFLVLFAIFSSTSAWDWIMSIDVHWFSTLFGWYVFSGMWVSTLITAILLIIYLKKKGYLKQVNDNHIHDLGKWMFAISFLWSYLWFSQFMLIWYANIPEEVTYYITRIENYKVLFFGTFLVNFVFPMLMLMSRDAKRHAGTLATIGIIIFLGHWVDIYILVTPGTMGNHASIGLLELGMFLIFTGVFIYKVLTTLTKAPLIPKNHPFLEESLHHEI